MEYWRVEGELNGEIKKSRAYATKAEALANYLSDDNGDEFQDIQHHKANTFVVRYDNNDEEDKRYKFSGNIEQYSIYCLMKENIPECLDSIVYMINRIYYGYTISSESTFINTKNGEIIKNINVRFFLDDDHIIQFSLNLLTDTICIYQYVISEGLLKPISELKIIDYSDFIKRDKNICKYILDCIKPIPYYYRVICEDAFIVYDNMIFDFYSLEAVDKFIKTKEKEIFKIYDSIKVLKVYNNFLVPYTCYYKYKKGEYANDKK